EASVMDSHLKNYGSYRGLPMLAGLATVADAGKPGLSVEQCVARLKRFHYAFKRLHHILTARITAEPIYELKTGFAHHAYLCAEHVTALRTRIAEMREPPLGLEDVPHPALEAFFDEILAAPTTEELLWGTYVFAVRGLYEAMEKYTRDTNPLTDAPSRRVIRFALLEVQDMMTWGEQCACLLIQKMDPPALARWREWEAILGDQLHMARGLDGTWTTPASR